jgi:signal transduction histidine kinase
MREVFRGVKWPDYAAAGVLTALGVILMRFDVAATDADIARQVADGGMVHAMSGHSPWMIPLFLGTTIPVLWWRRSVLAVTGVSLAFMVLHDVVFGWVTRCGAGLPLVFVLTFLGALTYGWRKAWLTAGLAALLGVAVVVRDSTTGFSVIALVLPVLLVVFGIGRAARRRTVLVRELRQRDIELRRLRDERAALTVADDRARLSQQLDGLLQQRLDELTTAAESGGGLAPAQARIVLEDIEAGSRRTLDDMREIVGLLRGGDVTLAPTPTVAHLDALLARRPAGNARLTVTGDPRSLPATVELSAYRIVEHLITALADRDESPIDVAVRFADRSLEIRVSGTVGSGADVKAAAARARERARLLGGSVDLKVSRGRAGAVAQLPVPA